MIESLNRVEISLSALRHNFSLLKAKAPDAAVLAMVKADGYGHGMSECARTLAAAGADCFGVAEAVEGVELRKNGIDRPVFIMAGLLPEIIPALFEYRLTPVVVDDSCLETLSREAVQRGQEIGLHLKVDAGMGRQGCALSSIGGIIRQIQTLPGLSLSGIMAHFPKADDPDSDSTTEITAAFGRRLEKVQELLPENLVLHLANSGGILYFPDSHQDMVRPGISLYGYYPNGEQGKMNAEEPRLQPVMRFTSRIIQIKEVAAGTGLGYGHTFTTSRPAKIAIIPAGYEDGYLRCLSNRAQALVHGQRVPAVGRISMNLTMFDVSDLGRVKLGDEVVLLGRQGDEEITADEIAAWMETISYEVLCLFGNLNNRVYVEPAEVSAFRSQQSD
jgi:alanine racemase